MASVSQRGREPAGARSAEGPQGALESAHQRLVALAVGQSHRPAFAELSVIVNSRCSSGSPVIVSSAEPSVRRELLQQLVQRIDVELDNLRFTIRSSVLGDPAGSHPEKQSADPAPGAEETLILAAPTHLPVRQHGGCTTISSGGSRRSHLDPKLIRAVAEGTAWYERMKSGEFPTLRALARSVGRDRPDVGRRIRLAFLAPDIVAAIVAGEQPRSLTIGSLVRDRDIPLSWAEQRRLFGFSDPRDSNR